MDPVYGAGFGLGMDTSEPVRKPNRRERRAQAAQARKESKAQVKRLEARFKRLWEAARVCTLCCPDCRGKKASKFATDCPSSLPSEYELT